MKMVLVRNVFTPVSTIGELTVDGVWAAHTLEDCVREVKIPKRTAIPAGTYSVIVNFSKRFERELPLLLDVPDFVGVRIHSGNTADDTEGCILVGTKKGTDRILRSRIAFDALFAKIQAAFSAGEEITIRIKNVRPEVST